MAEEKSFENRVKNFLKEQGAYFIKYWGGGAYTKSGVPDILACIGGAFVGIELKSSKGRLSELQVFNIKSIYNSGGFSLVLFPSDFDLFIDFVHLLIHNNLNEAEYLMNKINKSHGLYL